MRRRRPANRAVLSVHMIVIMPVMMAIPMAVTLRVTVIMVMLVVPMPVMMVIIRSPWGTSEPGINRCLFFDGIE